jgi:drug/metabolite transporter (DMT)-like permease
MGKRMTAWTKAGLIIGMFGWLVLVATSLTGEWDLKVQAQIAGIIAVLCGIGFRLAGIEETLYEDKDGDR